MSSEKLDHKEVKTPDPFVQFTSKMWTKIIEHQKAVGLVLLAVFAVFVVSALVVRVTQSKQKEAGGALALALDLAHRPVEGSLEALQDPTAEKFKTSKEKFEALAKALDEVRAKHPGSEAAATATLFWADAQFHLGKLDDAATGYDQFLALTREGNALRSMALEGLGYVAESKKDFEKAASAFDRMSKAAAGEPAKARAAYHRARMLEAQGKKAEAATAFGALRDEFKDAPAAREAEERLSLLAMQGVAVPEKKADKPAEKKN